MRLCIVKFCLKLLFFLLWKLIGKKLKECMNVVKMNIFFIENLKIKEWKGIFKIVLYCNFLI